MSSAGHVLDMINRMKQNRALLRRRHDKSKKLRNMYLNSVHYKDHTFHEKKISPEVCEKIKLEIRKKLKRDRIKNNIFRIFISILISFCTAFLLFNCLNKSVQIF
jgi:hypothetical protein